MFFHDLDQMSGVQLDARTPQLFLLLNAQYLVIARLVLNKSVVVLGAHTPSIELTVQLLFLEHPVFHTDELFGKLAGL